MSWAQTLPAELILHIASYVQPESSLSALARTSRRLYEICDPCLYRYHAAHGDNSALDWAALNGFMATFRKALDAAIFQRVLDDGAPLPVKQSTSSSIHHGSESSDFGSIESDLHSLSLAETGNYADTVKAIIDRRGGRYGEHAERYTLLSLTAIHGQTCIAKYLLRLGANQNIRSHRGYCPLSTAAAHGHKDLTDVLIRDLRERGDPNLENQMKEALFAAVVDEQESTVSTLVKHGVVLNFIRGNGQTPLAAAARNGSKDMVSLLLAHGADPNLVLTLRMHHAPLTVAVMWDHLDTARILVESTSNVHRTRALSYAVINSNRAMAEMLLANGAPPHFDASDIPAPPRLGTDTGDEWVQPILFAVENGDLDMLTLLLEYGVDVNTQCTEFSIIGRYGAKFDRVIFSAVNRGDDVMVKLLLEHGADTELVDAAGQPPLTYAVFGGNDAVIRSLLDHGANPYRVVDDGRENLASMLRMKESLLSDAKKKWSEQHGT